MDYKRAEAILRSDEWTIRFGSEPRRRKNIFEQITWMRSTAGSRKRLPADFHEVWLAHAEELRRLADVHEHAAMVDLHVNREKSWDQVRQALGLEKTRQALAKRWDRLNEMFSKEQRS